MIAAELQDKARQHPDRAFLVCPSAQWTYAEFAGYVARLARQLATLEPGRLCCQLPDSPELIALIFAASQCGRSLAVLNFDYDDAATRPLIEHIRPACVFTDRRYSVPPGCTIIGTDFLRSAASEVDADATTIAPDTAHDSEVLVFTSGTTGQPKCARYVWGNLLAQVRTSAAAAEQRWLLAYRINHFAGFQMLSHAVVNGATLVMAESTQISDMIDAMIRHRVTHLSSTPTFWRFALALLDGRQDQLELQQITLGSEAVPGDLLQKLHACFPAARIVHVYASTEAGSCVSVSDLKPGLPVSILDRPATADTRFRIVDDELQIQSAHGMSGYLQADGGETTGLAADGWRPTGDLVRVEDGRILFTGRKSETINVGGVKVQPLDVEHRISPLPGVKLVRAYGKKNPIVGQIVAVDVVCNPGFPAAAVEEDIRAACAGLAPAAQPRSIDFVDEIDINNLKISRRNSEQTD